MRIFCIVVAMIVVSASFAEIPTITVGPDPYPGEGATGAPQTVSVAAVQQCAPQLQVVAENLERLEATPPAERTVVVRQQMRTINRTLVRRKVIREELTLCQLTSLMAQLGLFGPADPWAKAYVDEAKARGLIVGTHAGYSSADPSCKAPISRQDAAVAMLRHDDSPNAHRVAIGGAIRQHDDSPNAHSGLLAALREEIRQQSLWGKIAFWTLVVLAVLALLAWALMRRRAVVAGYPAIGVVPPVAPGGGGVAPGPVAPFVPYSRGVGRRWV